MQGWKETYLRLFSSERCGVDERGTGTNEGQVKSRSFDRRKYRIQSGKLPRSLKPATGRRKQPLLVGTHCLPGMLFSTFQLRLKRIHRAKRKFCGSIHVCNARLKLQKILPGTFFIRVRVSFVAHMATIARSGWIIRKKAGCRLVEAASPQRPFPAGSSEICPPTQSALVTAASRGHRESPFYNHGCEERISRSCYFIEALIKNWGCDPSFSRTL